VRDVKEAVDSLDVFSVVARPFLNSSEVVFTRERRCRVFPVVFNLETLEVKEIVIPGLHPASAIADDVLGDSILFRSASPVETPRSGVLKGESVVYLTKSTTFSSYTYRIVETEQSNDAIDIIAPGEEKKFVVSPHGGPSGAFMTYFVRYYAFFYLNGYSLCLVNYRGSTGYPAEIQKSLPGHCGELDADDVLFHIDRVRETYTPVVKLGIWGWSHGGFLAAMIAGRNADKVDFAVAGAPCTNFVALYYTSDIPDWALVESGVRPDADGEKDIDPDDLRLLLAVSPVRYASRVQAPVLIIHGSRDRRVPPGQALDYFYALKRHRKQVKLLLYESPGHSMLFPETWDDTMISSVAFFEDPAGFIEHDYVAPEEKEKEKET
jgi:acylaminoacyl-peptidase